MKWSHFEWILSSVSYDWRYNMELLYMEIHMGNGISALLCVCVCGEKRGERTSRFFIYWLDFTWATFNCTICSFTSLPVNLPNRVLLVIDFLTLLPPAAEGCVCPWCLEAFPWKNVKGWRGAEPLPAGNHPSSFFSPFVSLFRDCNVCTLLLLVLIYGVFWPCHLSNFHFSQQLCSPTLNVTPSLVLQAAVGACDQFLSNR